MLKNFVWGKISGGSVFLVGYVYDEMDKADMDTKKYMGCVLCIFMCPANARKMTPRGHMYIIISCPSKFWPAMGIVADKAQSHA